MRFMMLMIPHGYENAAPGTIRQVQEMDDFPEDVQAAAAGFAEMQPR